jgi:hypothetical protein
MMRTEASDRVIERLSKKGGMNRNKMHLSQAAKLFKKVGLIQRPNIHEDGQTDDLEARLEVAKRAAFCHLRILSF